MAVSTTFEIDRVAYEADGWELGESTDAGAGFELAYTFNTPGERPIRAIAFGLDGQVIAETEKLITILDAQPTNEDSLDTDSRDERPTVSENGRSLF